MSTATISYMVTVNPSTNQPNLPSVAEIFYVDGNGNLQTLTNTSLPENQWGINFTATVGNEYYCGAREIQSIYPSTVQVLSNGTSVGSNSNSSSPEGLAGVSGTV